MILYIYIFIKKNIQQISLKSSCKLVPKIFNKLFLNIFTELDSINIISIRTDIIFNIFGFNKYNSYLTSKKYFFVMIMLILVNNFCVLKNKYYVIYNGELYM